MKWTDAQAIAEALFEAHPDVNPLDARFSDLHRWVSELEDFDDEPGKSNEGILEAIQMAWLDEWEE